MSDDTAAVRVGDAPLVGIVAVVFRQSGEELRRFLEGIAGLSYLPRRLYLANNEPTRSIDKLGNGKATRVVEAGRNRGWTGGANLAAERALQDGCQYVLFLNTDVEFLAPTLIERLIDAFDRDSKCGLVSPAIVCWPDMGRVWYRGGKLWSWAWIPRHPGIGRRWRDGGRDIVPTGIICGCCVLSSARALDATGGFDESLFMYFDDPDLSVRTASRGLRCYLVDEPLVAHWESSRRLSVVAAYYFGRNPLLLLRKHRPGLRCLPGVVANFAAAPIYMLRAGSIAGARSYLRGMRDGLKLVCGLGESRPGDRA